MKIFFRTDASVQIGTGHVMRCLTLADGLRQHRAECTFLCRPHLGNLLDLICERGHSVLPLESPERDFKTPEDLSHAAWLGTSWQSDAIQSTQVLNGQKIDWLIVDHYALDARWERFMRSCARQIMVIDDLADRPHECDLLLDQNLGRVRQDYQPLINKRTQLLLGPKYALLRPEFSRLRGNSLKRRIHPQLNQLLITMGGVDKDNITGQILEALRSCELPVHLKIIVVMGPNAPWLSQVRSQASTMPWSTSVVSGISNMAELMSDCDLAIGAAGGTAWERCALGLPTIVLTMAENQESGAKALHAADAILVLSNVYDLQRVLHVANNSIRLQMISKAAAAITDGLGVNRVLSEIISNHV